MKKLDGTMRRSKVRLRSAAGAACTALTAALLFMHPSFARTQSAQPSTSAAPGNDASFPLPTFEVASVKASDPNANGPRLMYKADGIAMSDFPLALLFRYAFNIEDDRLIGLPAWVKSSHFDIDAKVTPEDAPKLKSLSYAQRNTMVIGLLVDRFGLKYHRETRALPVYELVIAKGGVKMQAAKEQDPATAVHLMSFGAPSEIDSTAAKVGKLAHMLSVKLGRTVVDKTGLTGDFDFTLTWTPDIAASATASLGDASSASNDDSGDDPDSPSLFTALKEQLGLKLVSAKDPEEVIVIDHIEQPSTN
jgi:bla regulator protein blaR1